MKLIEFLDTLDATRGFYEKCKIWEWMAPDGTKYNYIDDENVFRTLSDLNEMIKAGRFEGLQ